MYILMYIFGGIIFGILLGMILGRWALRLGVLLLLLGIGPFFALYIYETSFYAAGDTSAEGMLSTIMLILFAPMGLVLTTVGLIHHR